jgi:hypothetical protein
VPAVVRGPLLVDDPSGHLPDQHQHRDRLVVGVLHRTGEADRTGSARGEADADTDSGSRETVGRAPRDLPCPVASRRGCDV